MNLRSRAMALPSPRELPVTRATRCCLEGMRTIIPPQSGSSAIRAQRDGAPMTSSARLAAHIVSGGWVSGRRALPRDYHDCRGTPIAVVTDWPASPRATHWTWDPIRERSKGVSFNRSNDCRSLRLGKSSVTPPDEGAVSAVRCPSWSAPELRGSGFGEPLRDTQGCASDSRRGDVGVRQDHCRASHRGVDRCAVLRTRSARFRV